MYFAPKVVMANFTELNSIGRPQEEDLHIGTWFPFLNDDDDDDDDDDCGRDKKPFTNYVHREQMTLDHRFLDVGKLSVMQQHPLIVVPNTWEFSSNGYDELLESGPTSATSWPASDVCSVDSIGKISSVLSSTVIQAGRSP
jgi:hypothetical protein